MQQQMTLDITVLEQKPVMQWQIIQFDSEDGIAYNRSYLQVEYDRILGGCMYWSNKLQSADEFAQKLARWFIEHQPQLTEWQFNFIRNHKSIAVMEYIKECIKHEISH